MRQRSVLMVAVEVMVVACLAGCGEKSAQFVQQTAESVPVVLAGIERSGYVAQGRLDIHLNGRPGLFQESKLGMDAGGQATISVEIRPRDRATTQPAPGDTR